MTENSAATWIHLAGHPAGVKNGKPPYWRYRLGHGGKEHLIDTWAVLAGQFDATNNTQGVELKASFLLWYALYGELVVEETPAGERHARITLLPGPLTTDFSLGEPVREVTGELHLYGAPDRVSQGSSLWWRARVEEQSFDLCRWRLVGAARGFANNGGRADMAREMLERLWLFFTQARVQVDTEQNALITLI